MPDNELTDFEKFKLAAIDENIADKHVNVLFLNLEINSEAEISEVVGILIKHRPELYKKYKQYFTKNPPNSPAK